MVPISERDNRLSGDQIVQAFDGQVVDRITAALRKDILQGEFSEGEPLRQGTIAKRFDTSRVPVREALRMLEAEGLVVFHPRRGASVLSVDPIELLEMFDIRIALETRLLRLAVPNMTNGDFAEAAAILAEYDGIADGISPEAWDDLNWRFHAKLYVSAHRPTMFNLARSNYYKQARSLRVRIAKARAYDGPHQEHYQILDACRQKDADIAAMLLEDHLANTQKSVATEMHLTKIGALSL